MRVIRGEWSGDDKRMRGESQRNLGDLGKKTNRMSSAEGTEERVDDKGDSGTYCTCEGNP